MSCAKGHLGETQGFEISEQVRRIILEPVITALTSERLLLNDLDNFLHNVDYAKKYAQSTSSVRLIAKSCTASIQTRLNRVAVVLGVSTVHAHVTTAKPAFPIPRLGSAVD